jgi:hypothetical protein
MPASGLRARFKLRIATFTGSPTDSLSEHPC